MVGVLGMTHDQLKMLVDKLERWQDAADEKRRLRS